MRKNKRLSVSTTSISRSGAEEPGNEANILLPVQYTIRRAICFSMGLQPRLGLAGQGRDFINDLVMNCRNILLHDVSTSVT